MPPTIVELLEKRFGSRDEAIAAVVECEDAILSIKTHPELALIDNRTHHIEWVQSERVHSASLSFDFCTVLAAQCFWRWTPDLESDRLVPASRKTCYSCGYYLPAPSSSCMALHQEMNADTCGDWATKLPELERSRIEIAQNPSAQTLCFSVIDRLAYLFWQARSRE